jgi:hypothetical protein
MPIAPPRPVVKDAPPIITICGDAGTGKTSLAATFPNAVVIRAEDGLKSIPAAQRPDAFDLLKTADDLWEQLIWLGKEKHDYKTLIIDSVSRLEELFVAECLAKDGKAKTLNTAMGGYGAGRQYVAGQHARVRKLCGRLNEARGMAIIFISHADIETMRLPDVDDYQRYSLRLMKDSLPPYVDDVDMVAFVRLTAALRGDDGDRKKVVSNGDRDVVCHATAASVSKNRYGITEPLDFVAGENPFASIFGLKPKRTPKAAPKASEPDPVDGDEDPADYANND